MIFLFDYPPPAQFDHLCVQCGVVVKSLPELRRTCTAMGVKLDHGLLYGCSWRGPAGCTIVIPKLSPEIDQLDQDMVRRVENANCNGWPKGNRE